MLPGVPAVSSQVRLALDALRAVGRDPSPLPVERLASALMVPADRLLEVLGPLQHAGWVHREAGAGDTVRYLRPVPPPTLQEVIEAIEGSTPVDDCVLNPGVPCGGLRSAPVCAGHRTWTDQLTASALAVGGLIGTGEWRRSMPASRDVHLGSDRLEPRSVADPRPADPRPADPRPADPRPADPAGPAVEATALRADAAGAGAAEDAPC